MRPSLPLLLATSAIAGSVLPLAAQLDADGDGLVKICSYGWSHMGHEAYGFAEVTYQELEALAVNFHTVPYQANPDGTCPPREEAVSLEVGVCTFGLGQVTGATGTRTEWRWNFAFHSLPYYEKQSTSNPGWIALADGYTCPSVPPVAWEPDPMAS